MEDGCVVINDNLIEDIGIIEEMKVKYLVYEFIDVGKKIIMLGLINLYMYIYSLFVRGMVVLGKFFENFLEILNNLWWRFDK